jgi:hypothetical protein
MPKLSDIRRIIPEDYPDDFQESAGMIAGSYNEFADEIYQVVNGGLDFDNLARALGTIEVVFDASGNIVGNSTIVTKLSYVSMIHLGKVQNLTNASAKLTQIPFIDWVHIGNGSIKISYGIGFTVGVKYRLTLEIIK